MGACDGSLGTRAALSTTHYHRHTRRQPLIPHKKKNTSHNTHADQWLFNAFAASREGVVLDRISVWIIIAIDKWNNITKKNPLNYIELIIYNARGILFW